MDPRLAFWALALVDLFAAVACAAAGWRRIRRGDVEGHRGLMNAAAALVVLFLAAYLVKVAVLGKEDLAAWSRTWLALLYFHETVVGTMLLAGGTARFLAWRLGRSGALRLQGGPVQAAPPTRLVTWHRRLGMVAVVSGLVAVATAVLIFLGMTAGTI